MAFWSKEFPEDRKIKAIVFLISPFLSFLYALRRMNTRSSYVVFFLFALCFGMAFTIGTNRGSRGLDSSFYRSYFEENQNITYDDFLQSFNSYLTFKEAKKDFYFDTIAFGVSRLTDNYHVLFLVFAAIFATFQLKTLRFFTSHPNFKFSTLCLLLAFLFTYNQIFNINGVRFWTAAWIGVYAVFKIFLKEDKRYFLLVLFTPFFHGAFSVFVAFVILAYFTRKFEKTWIVLFFVSFAFSSFVVELVKNIGQFLPPFLAKLVNSYTSESMLSKGEQGTGFYWVTEMFDFIRQIYINLLIVFLIKKRHLIILKPEKNLLAFLIVWMALSNFLMPVPSLGIRYMVMSYPFIAYILLAIPKDKMCKYLIYFMPFAFFVNIYNLFVNYSTVLDPFFIVSSPFLLIYRYLL